MIYNFIFKNAHATRLIVHNCLYSYMYIYMVRCNHHLLCFNVLNHNLMFLMDFNVQEYNPEKDVSIKTVQLHVHFI